VRLSSRSLSLARQLAGSGPSAAAAAAGEEVAEPPSASHPSSSASQGISRSAGSGSVAPTYQTRPRRSLTHQVQVVQGPMQTSAHIYCNLQALSPGSHCRSANSSLPSSTRGNTYRTLKMSGKVSKKRLLLLTCCCCPPTGCHVTLACCHLCLQLALLRSLGTRGCLNDVRSGAPPVRAPTAAAVVITSWQKGSICLRNHLKSC